MTNTNTQVAQFILDDLKRTLFPLKLSEFIAQYAQENLHEFIEKINKDKENFNPHDLAKLRLKSKIK